MILYMKVTEWSDICELSFLASSEIKNQDFIFILIEGKDVQQKPHFNHS